MEARKLVYVIPLLVILYISHMYSEYSAIPDSSAGTEDSTPFIIDVGGSDTKGYAAFLGPFDRVSEPLIRDNITYRLIEKDLVYFSSGIKQNSSRVKVELRFVDTIPQGYDLKIGMKNAKEWSYMWSPLYTPFYRSLEKFNLTGETGELQIYSLNDNISIPVSSFLSSPPAGSIIASGVPGILDTAPEISLMAPNSSTGELRGDHTMYIYAKGHVRLTVMKQDINWYNGTDTLEIKLYSSGKLLKNITMPDDGIAGNDHSRGPLQTGNLEADLDEGVYEVTMSTGGNDMLIGSVELNNGSIVVKNPFLAGILYTGAKRFDLYTRVIRGDRIGFQTYHAEGLQTVNITRGNYTRSFNVGADKEWHYIDLPPGNELYRIEIPKGDIIINANSYFSFSENSFFSPSTARVFPLDNNLEWLTKNKVDYVIIPRQQVTRDGNWTIASAQFDMSAAYIENNELNFVISAPHIKDSNYSIPLDWIKIYMEK